jgi:hypothetical protein
MIHFFVDRGGAEGIKNYLADRGAVLAGSLVPRLYDEVTELRAIRPGPAIFAGVDQIGHGEREFAALLHRTLAEHGNPVLNHPTRVLRRLDLLTTLHERKVNGFRAVRAVDSYRHLRFPVFVREENRHTGTKSGLLGDAVAVERAIALLALKGWRRDQLLVVEFCDTRSADGLYRKYSAFRIGDQILPRHVHISRHWVSKSKSSVITRETIAEEADYFAANPHESWLREIFNLARIEYGRIDYGLIDGTPQVWEINTNPTLGRRPGRAPRAGAELRAFSEPLRLHFHTAFCKALLELDSTQSEASKDLPIVVPRGLIDRAAADRIRLRRRRKGVVKRLRGVASALRLRRILYPVALAITTVLGRTRAMRAAGARR